MLLSSAPRHKQSNLCYYCKTVNNLVFPQGTALGACCNAASASPPPAPHPSLAALWDPRAEQSQGWISAFNRAATPTLPAAAKGFVQSPAQRLLLLLPQEHCSGCPQRLPAQEATLGWGSSCRVKLHFTFQMLRFKDWSFTGHRHGPTAGGHGLVEFPFLFLSLPSTSPRI